MNNYGFWITPNGFGSIVEDKIDMFGDFVALGDKPQYRPITEGSLDFQFFVIVKNNGIDGFDLQINGTDEDTPTKLHVDMDFTILSPETLTHLAEALLLLAADNNS